MFKKSESPREPKFGLANFKQKTLLIFLFILLNIAVITATAVVEFSNPKEVADLSKASINWWLIVPAALCFCVAIYIEIHKYVIMIKEMYKERGGYDAKKMRKLASRTVLLGKYYDNITPAAIGAAISNILYAKKQRS